MDFVFLILCCSFLLTGLISGFIAGLLGVGGGIIIIPITYYILLYLGYSIEVVMHVSIASSLGIIVFTSSSSILSHFKLKNIDFNIVKNWVPGVIFGSIIGSYIASQINGEFLIIIFVTLLFLISLNLFLQKKFILSKTLPKSYSLNFVISFAISFFSVLMGIGGGSFSVPTLCSFSKPIHKAVGTSATLGFFIAFPGVVTYSIAGYNVSGLPPYSLGYANLIIILLVSSTSVFTANIGAKFSSKTKTSTLQKIFAVFLFCTCISLVI